jgi:hypothetical protein
LVQRVNLVRVRDLNGVRRGQLPLDRGVASLLVPVLDAAPRSLRPVIFLVRLHPMVIVLLVQNAVVVGRLDIYEVALLLLERGQVHILHTCWQVHGKVKVAIPRRLLVRFAGVTEHALRLSDVGQGLETTGVVHNLLLDRRLNVFDLGLRILLSFRVARKHLRDAVRG